jgi:ribose 5-phosphate isomerase B
MKSILIASDHAGFALKEALKPYLKKNKITAVDLGAHSLESCDYPDYAAALAKQVAQGKVKRGILICKTGIGNSIAANRFTGVRAALCYNVTAARLSREHNDSNVLVLGSYFVNAEAAKKILRAWLNTGFAGGRHKRRLNKIERFCRA